jgi:hypothetical protein
MLEFRGASEHTRATPSGYYRNHNGPVISYNAEPDASLRLNTGFQEYSRRTLYDVIFTET